MSRRHNLTRPVDTTDHVRGRWDAPLTLVEYSDYECAACAEVRPIVAALRRELGDALRLVHRHFPLRMHPHAHVAAEAAEAAGAQERFWDLHDLLEAHWDQLSDERIRALAVDAGLDRARFDAELTAGTFRERILTQRAEGARSGVRGTPAFFIGGRRYDGPRDLDSLVAALRAAQ